MYIQECEVSKKSWFFWKINYSKRMSTKKVRKYVDFRRCQTISYNAGKTIITCTSFEDIEANLRPFFKCFAVKISRERTLPFALYYAWPLSVYKAHIFPCVASNYMVFKWSYTLPADHITTRETINQFTKAFVRFILRISQPLLSFIFFSSQFKKFVMTTRQQAYTSAWSSW